MVYVSIIKTLQVVPFLIPYCFLSFAQNRNLTVEDQSSACYALWQMAMGCVYLHQNRCKKTQAIGVLKVDPCLFACHESSSHFSGSVVMTRDYSVNSYENQAFCIQNLASFDAILCLLQNLVWCRDPETLLRYRHLIRLLCSALVFIHCLNNPRLSFLIFYYTKSWKPEIIRGCHSAGKEYMYKKKSSHLLSFLIL